MTEILTPRSFARVVERKQLWAVGGLAVPHTVEPPTAHNCLRRVKLISHGNGKHIELAVLAKRTVCIKNKKLMNIGN
jgi:hypothetical protein